MTARTPAPLDIRAMTSGDVPAAVAVLVRGGWPERAAFFRHLLAVPECQVLVGELDGEVVATGVAAACGDVGWVGTIFVHHTLRRRGYGQAMTEAVCERLEAAGCRTLALIASDLGRPVYEQMGFRIDAWHRIYTASPLERAPEEFVGSPGTNVRPAAPGDLPAICALDAAATGCDRGGLLRSAARGTWVVERGGEILGFRAAIEAAWSAVVAAEPDVARDLLQIARGLAPRSLQGTHAAIVEGSRGGVALLAELGWAYAFTTPRMLRGPAVPWRPEMIWGILGPAFG